MDDTPIRRASVVAYATTPVHSGLAALTQHPEDSMTGQTQRQPSTWKYGLKLFAGIMMVVIGALEAIQGLVALFNNDVYLATPNYIFAFDITAWGWIHLILGLLLVVIGFLVISGRLVGRILGIVVVGISAILSFASMPYYPLWSILVIALEVFVIWALATYHDSETD